MTATTIKVPSAVRDRLQEQASGQEHTLGEHVAYLVAREERRLRMVALREAVERTSAEDLGAYTREADELDQAFARDGLSRW